MMMMMTSSSTLMTSSSSSSFDNVFKKKASSSSFRLNTLKTTAKTMRNNNKVQQKNVTIKAEAISEDSSSKNSSDIFADLVENSSFGSSHNNNGFVERGEHIISLSIKILL